MRFASAESASKNPIEEHHEKPMVDLTQRKALDRLL
jgi:hypothetical protein